MKTFTVWVALPWFAFLIQAASFGAGPAAPSAEPARVEAVVAGDTVETAPVVVEGRVLVTYRAALEFPDVRQRAQAAAERVASALGKFNAGSLSIKPLQVGGYSGYAVADGHRFLLTVVEADVDPSSGYTAEGVAARAAAEIRHLAGDRASRTPAPTLLKGTIQSGVATLLFAAAWALVYAMRTRLLRAVARAAHKAGQALKLFGYDWRPILLDIASSVIRLAMLVVVLCSAYIWLAYVFSRFSGTQSWGNLLGDYLYEALVTLLNNAVQELPNLAALFVIYVVTRGLIRVLNTWFTSIESGRFSTVWLDPEAARATRRLADIGVWIVALIVAFPYLPGSHSEGFRGVSVFLGLMLSLGGAGFVGQVIGGLAAVYSRAVRSGDYIIVGETQGIVKELGLLTTKVITRNREEVTLPNSLLISSAIRNLSRAGNRGTLLTTAVTIGYDAPWRRVEALLLKAAGRTEGLLKEPPPFVLQTTLDDFYVRYELTAVAEAAGVRAQALARLHGHIQDEFNESGIQIMSPHFELQPADPVVVPKEKWGKEEKSPH